MLHALLHHIVLELFLLEEHPVAEGTLLTCLALGSPLRTINSQLLHNKEVPGLVDCHRLPVHSLPGLSGLLAAWALHAHGHDLAALASLPSRVYGQAM